MSLNERDAETVFHGSMDGCSVGVKVRQPNLDVTLPGKSKKSPPAMEDFSFFGGRGYTPAVNCRDTSRMLRFAARSRLILILAALSATASFASDWRPAQSSSIETPDKDERRFVAESGISFLYRDGMVARSYWDGAKEVVFLGENGAEPPEKKIPVPSDFHARPVMRLELIPKGVAGAESSLEGMAIAALRSRADLSVSSESLADSWPPGSFVLRDRKTARPLAYYSQTKDRWVVLSVFGPNAWELDLMRRGLSESLEDKSRVEGLREPLPRIRVRALPRTGLDDLNEFEGATGLRFRFQSSWILESRVRDGVERAWLHPAIDFEPVRRNTAEPGDFRRPENFARLSLVLVEATPKKSGAGPPRTLAALREARLTELSKERVECSTRAGANFGNPEDWPADTFSVQVAKPYAFQEIYTQNDGYLIRYASGKLNSWGDGGHEIAYAIQDHVANVRPRLPGSIPERTIEPRGLPLDPSALILVVLGIALARRRGRPDLSRMGRACAAVVSASFVGAVIAGRMPRHFFLGAGLEHALAFAAFGLAIAHDKTARRKAALMGAAAGFLQGILLGWAPMAWAYFNAGGGPGSALLTHIGFFYADLGPVLLLPLNLWTQALVGSLVIGAAVREDRFRRVAGSVVLTSLPLLLLPVVSLLILAAAAFLNLFQSIPAQHGAVACLCLCGASYGPRVAAWVVESIFAPERKVLKSSK